MCAGYVEEHIAAIKLKIAEAQDAANDDTKSSAGDKYEVSREMMQQEIDLDMTRLAEMQKHKAALERIDPTQHMDKGQSGALVYTSNGNYFLAIPAGKLLADGVSCYAISAEAPIALQMLGKNARDEFVQNGKVIRITSVE